MSSFKLLSLLVWLSYWRLDWDETLILTVVDLVLRTENDIGSPVATHALVKIEFLLVSFRETLRTLLRWLLWIWIFEADCAASHGNALLHFLFLRNAIHGTFGANATAIWIFRQSSILKSALFKDFLAGILVIFRHSQRLRWAISERAYFRFYPR